MNVGFALGGLVAGAIARTAHPSTFTFLFLLNAVTFLVFVVVLQFVPSPRHREAHARARPLRATCRATASSSPTSS